MSGQSKKQEIIPELQIAIERLLATDCLSEELKIIAIKKAQDLISLHQPKDLNTSEVG